MQPLKKYNPRCGTGWKEGSSHGWCTKPPEFCLWELSWAVLLQPAVLTPNRGGTPKVEAARHPYKLVRGESHGLVGGRWMETAFNTPLGHFENLLMSFGLTNAKTFQSITVPFTASLKQYRLGKLLEWEETSSWPLILEGSHLLLWSVDYINNVI